MKETIFKIFDTFTEGVDTYYHNGSIWLIFTDEQKWVIELAQDGILWYNSYFFGDCLKYVSLNVVDNQHYITEWVENIIQNGVKSTYSQPITSRPPVEDTIQNGVKSTKCDMANEKQSVEDTIQNGIKALKGDGNAWVDDVRVIIDEGIKETHEDVYQSNARVYGVVNNGIKQTIELPDMSGETNGYGYYYERQKDKTYPHAYIVNDVINGK